jgi:hypothetical protein
MFQPNSANLKQLSHLLKLLHCIFSVIKMNYFVKIFQRFQLCHPIIKRHLFESVTRYVLLHCLPRAALMSCVLFCVACVDIM